MQKNNPDYMFLVVRNFTFLGNILPQFLICLALMFVDLERAFYITWLWAGAYAINLVIKNTVRKARPDEALRRIHVKGYSFASGHAVTSLALYFSIAKYFWNELPLALIILLLAMPILLGLSRLYLRVHFLVDVVGGWIIAYAYLFFFGDFITAQCAKIYPWFSLLLASWFNV